MARKDQNQLDTGTGKEKGVSLTFDAATKATTSVATYLAIRQIKTRQAFTLAGFQ
jgi:hypothetical protein